MLCVTGVTVSCQHCYFCCRSIVALLVAVPDVAGASLTSELYSPHLDVHQRMLILETLATAAQQMANPGLKLEAGRGQTDGQVDRLKGSDVSSSGEHGQEGKGFCARCHMGAACE